MKENENKNQKTVDQQQGEPQKKESFLKRTCKRFGRDVLDIAIGGVIGGIVVGSIFRARSGNAAEETAAEEDQETEDEEDVSEEDSEE